jgi:hypothetical protein
MGHMKSHRRTLLAVVVLAVGLGSPIRDPGAHEIDGMRGGVVEPPTRFERFLLWGCVPCVTESYPVATLPIGAMKISGLPQPGGSWAARSGEIRVETVRAYQFGRPSRQSLALRLTLSIAVGVGGEYYRLAVGLVDEEEVAALSTAVSDFAQLAPTKSSEASAEHTDTSLREGSLRIGLLRLRSESVAYAQAGDLSMLALRPVWDVPTTMYFPPEQLPALAKAIGRAAAKIRQLRGA